MRFPHFIRSFGFTLVELLTVVAIIIVLMGLTLGVSGYVRNKGAESRAQAEIAALEGALERYRIDFGGYPYTTRSGGYDTKTNPDTVATKMLGGNVPASDLRPASLELYYALSGFDPDSSSYTGKAYFEFGPQMLEGVTGKTFNPANVTAVVDPWGFPYGFYVPDPNDATTIVINPTFDLYSIGATQQKAKGMTDIDQLQEAWISNW